MLDKNKSFEYLLLKLKAWYVETNGLAANNLSVLKTLKFLFLVTAADIEIKGRGRDEEFLINTTFNNFYAMPLGHVESDVYSYITSSKGNLQYFNIDKTGLTKNDIEFNDYDNIDTISIDIAISFLRQQYPELINKEPFELVDLTHKWNSWRFFYSGRKKASYAIPSPVIIQEVKYFR